MSSSSSSSSFPGTTQLSSDQNLSAEYLLLQPYPDQFDHIFENCEPLLLHSQFQAQSSVKQQEMRGNKSSGAATLAVVTGRTWS